MTVRHVLELRDGGLNGLDAVFVQQPDEIAFSDATGSILRIQVAFLVATCAHVAVQKVDDIITALAAFPKLDRWNAQALGIEFPGAGVVARRHRSADVRDVSLADRPEDQLALIEDGLVHAAVKNVTAHVHGIVVVDDVAFVDVITEVGSNGLHGRHQ